MLEQVGDLALGVAAIARATDNGGKRSARGYAMPTWLLHRRRTRALIGEINAPPAAYSATGSPNTYAGPIR